jgi:hypothetical protein
MARDEQRVVIDRKNDFVSRQLNAAIALKRGPLRFTQTEVTNTGKPNSNHSLDFIIRRVVYNDDFNGHGLIQARADQRPQFVNAVTTRNYD